MYSRCLTRCPIPWSARRSFAVLALLALGHRRGGVRPGGREGDTFRKVVARSVGLVSAMAVLALPQSTGVLWWMVP